jgi:hypothetical protein
VKQTLLEIEQNIASRKEKDRIMWFSMWAVLAVASFGIAWFPMIYYAIKRRNDHFARQAKLEALILKKLGTDETENQSATLGHRNAGLLTTLTVLIVPAFYVFYVLKGDLHRHEAHEQVFLAQVRELTKDSDVQLNVEEFMTTPSFPLGKYVGLSVASLGLAAAYWMYRIFNDYNSHFKMQWIIEDELLRFLKATEEKSA